MKILILSLLILGVTARPERRRPWLDNLGPSRSPLGPPPPPPGRGGPPPPPPGRGGPPLPPPGREGPPYAPGQDGPMWEDDYYPGPMGGAGEEEWIPPFDSPATDYGWGLEDDEPMRPPCPPDYDMGPVGPDTDFEGPTAGPDQGGRGDRLPRRSPGEERPEPGSDRPRRPRRRGQGVRKERPERPERGGRRRERPQRPRGQKRRDPSRRPNRVPFGGATMSPEEQAQRQFFPIFKAENVTIQNTTDLFLHEGNNTFILPRARGQHGRLRGEQNAPLEQFGYGGYGYGGFLPYLTLKYNPTATPTVSFEYGVTQFFPTG